MVKRIIAGFIERTRAFARDDQGIGVVELILILVGICIADKSRILCGNFRCI